uniref:Ig-like domain-containing protein n=1 Tax=Sparus aurata TaxID=8175 RepID=A0A671XM02_SPAAU
MLKRSHWWFCNTTRSFSFTGLIDGSDVTQTPLLWMMEGQSATMDCNHTKGATYYQMYWYRQLPGQRMKQIVFTTQSPPHQYESGFSAEKFPATKKNPGDKGLYFCAVSQHSDTDT